VLLAIHVEDLAHEIVQFIVPAHPQDLSNNERQATCQHRKYPRCGFCRGPTVEPSRA
jgi:hypothetical protein